MLKGTCYQWHDLGGVVGVAALGADLGVVRGGKITAAAAATQSYQWDGCSWTLLLPPMSPAAPGAQLPCYASASYEGSQPGSEDEDSTTFLGSLPRG